MRGIMGRSPNAVLFALRDRLPSTAKESGPSPFVRRAILAARPSKVCGSKSAWSPATSSSPGSVAILVKMSKRNQRNEFNIDLHALQSWK